MIHLRRAQGLLINHLLKEPWSRPQSNNDCLTSFRDEHFVSIESYYNAVTSHFLQDREPRGTYLDGNSELDAYV